MNDKKAIVVLSLFYFASFLMMLPLRSAAFLDDFAYIHTAERLHNTGVLRISDWAGTSLVFQILWSNIFTKFLGFSIPVLHFSNIVLFYFGLISFYVISRNLGFKPLRSFIMSLFLLMYPWVFSYLYTYMSDVFFLSLELIAIAFLINGFKSNKRIYFFFGSTFSGLAFLSRQLGLVIPIALVIVFLIQWKIGKPQKLKNILYTLVPALFIIVAYYIWIQRVGTPAANYIFFNQYTRKNILAPMIPQALNRIGVTNRLYIDLLLQRIPIYTISVFTHLLPFFLIFKFSPLIQFIRKNLRLIVKIVFFIGLYTILVKNVDVNVFRIPSEFKGYDKITVFWVLNWKNVFWLSSLYLVTIATFYVSKLTKLLVKRKRNLVTWKLYWVVFLGLNLILYHKTLIGMYSAQLRGFDNFMIIKALFDREMFIGTIMEGWLVTILLFLLALTFWMLLSHKIQLQKKVNPGIILISLVLLGEVLITVFLPHSHWEEYTIAWMPFIIILASHAFRKIEISKTKAIAMLIFAFFLGIAPIRNRYHEEGVRWEMGAKLVEAGINPNYISDQNLAWHRYWFWEESFQEVVNEKYNGDKYQVQPSDFDTLSKKLPSGEIYCVTQLPSTEIPIDSKYYFQDLSFPIVGYSDIYWVFSKEFYSQIRLVSIKVQKK